MKAAILYKTGQPLIVDEVKLPDNLEFGQVLIKLYYSGICGAQINEIDAIKGEDNYLPHLLGHEGSGIVENIGPAVSTVKVGDHVVLHWRPSNGIQSNPPSYLWNNKKLNAGWVTTFNDKAVISENRLTVIPKDFDVALAPLFGCAITTAFGVINNDANLKIGQSVVVIGLGGVGLNIVQASNLVSANPIIGVDINKNKVIKAKNFGLDYGYNGLNENNINEIKAVLGNRGADVVIETTGLSEQIQNAYDLTHPDGKTILVGVPKKGDNISIYSLPLHFNKILKGSHGGESIPHIDIPNYINLFKARNINIKDMITHEFSLDDINEALELFRSGEAGRIMLNFEK
jgi:S-(hydroxymethyl)glutathione dehydrogenase/alcohol dehydrogenase